MARKGFEEGRITAEEFGLVCDLIRQKLIQSESAVERFVCEKTWADHRHADGTRIGMDERDFFLELAEWSMLGAMSRDIVAIMRQKFLKTMEVPSVERVREEFKITFDHVMDGTIRQDLNPDYRGIPLEVIPLLSDEAKKYMFETSRKTRFSGKEAFNPKVIHYSQDKALRKALGRDGDPKEHDEEAA